MHSNASNLYEWAMINYFPINEFEYLTDKEARFDIC